MFPLTREVISTAHARVLDMSQPLLAAEGLELLRQSIVIAVIAVVAALALGLLAGPEVGSGFMFIVLALLTIAWYSHYRGWERLCAVRKPLCTVYRAVKWGFPVAIALLVLGALVVLAKPQGEIVIPLSNRSIPYHVLIGAVLLTAGIVMSLLVMLTVLIGFWKISNTYGIGSVKWGALLATVSIPLIPLGVGWLLALVGLALLYLGLGDAAAKARAGKG